MARQNDDEEQPSKRQKVDLAAKLPKLAAAKHAVGKEGPNLSGNNNAEQRPPRTGKKPAAKVKPTKFQELLLGDAQTANNKDGFLQDLKLQQQLEKKLGIKKVCVCTV